MRFCKIWGMGHSEQSEESYNTEINNLTDPSQMFG